MRSALLLMVVAVAVAGAAVAAEPTATAVACTGVKDRAPEGAADTFPTSVGQVYCFTEARAVTGKVVHVWYHGDKEVGRIELPVRAERWRTWSAKKVLPGMTGSWRVEVQDETGKALATVSFSVE